MTGPESKAISQPTGEVGPDWQFTNDPADPCGLCVQWEEQEGDYLGEYARPVWPDGKTAERIYYGVHGGCEAAAMAYSYESRNS